MQRAPKDRILIRTLKRLTAEVEVHTADLNRRIGSPNPEHAAVTPEYSDAVYEFQKAVRMLEYTVAVGRRKPNESKSKANQKATSNHGA